MDDNGVKLQELYGYIWEILDLFANFSAFKIFTFLFNEYLKNGKPKHWAGTYDIIE